MLIFTLSKEELGIILLSYIMDLRKKIYYCEHWKKICVLILVLNFFILIQLTIRFEEVVDIQMGLLVLVSQIFGQWTMYCRIDVWPLDTIHNKTFINKGFTDICILLDR